MKEPVLVIMAAGMGSRYGGLKQIDPVDAWGNIIIDYSIFDAIEAGFKKIVFIIKKENEADFREGIGSRAGKYAEVQFVYQELSNLPEGFSVPEGRVKPFGTAHAVLCCKDVIDGPFAVINSDDYYGKSAFRQIYDYLSRTEDDEKYHYVMVGYRLGNTLTENGYVSRGCCVTDEQENLVSVTERTMIEKRPNGAAYSEDKGDTWTDISPETVVSMNMWGFGKSFLKELENRFAGFLTENLPVNPLKCEYFLPFVVTELLKEEKADVKVLKSEDKWYGVTYHEDKQSVVDALASMRKKGMYPEKVWEK
ncbi:MAG: sugar phosphate nucleotidyltransferase [Lachnospiraceae bacterium]|nr:sugar phosphate nucleotidyltransferase [Lachnospiraceae bacterium]